MLINNSEAFSVLSRPANTHQVATTSSDLFSDTLKNTLPSRTARDMTHSADLIRERNYMLEKAKTSPSEAATLAFGYTHNSLSSALLDLSDRPNIRYAATGELVTPLTEQYFSHMSQTMQQHCNNLYRQEVSKGTPAEEILQKIFNFHDSMPARFKGMLGL
ncbi:hypothetical protein ACIQAL_23750 [Pseudomonas sp. NPDC088368]|jgi:hypothetical protein|uniref:hypothetical protein n=1 Tax=Pseudomonas sp. NPDC088368 TaxID=3364453 RepID=UPI0038106B8A